MSDPSIFTQPRQAPVTFNTLPLGVNKGGASPLALLSIQRHSASYHQPPLLAIKEEPRLEHHRPRLSLLVPHVPGKTRKRHKRKCDGGVPCSNCKRNKADCLYTDAQQSRSTWGDLPLSQEKIIGVSASGEDDDTTIIPERSSKPLSASQSGAAGVPTLAASSSATTTATSSPTSSRVSKSTAQPSALLSTAPTPASKSPSNQPSQKGYTKQSARIPDSFASPFPASTLTPQAHFIPGHASYEQDFNLVRRKQQLDMQSAQISRAIRVARPGPQADISILLNGDSSAQRLDRGLVRGLSQDSSLVAQGLSSPINNTSNNTRPRVTSSQPVPNTLWRQDPDTMAGPMATFSKQQPQQPHQQQHLLHQQQYHPSPADSLEVRQSSILPPAQPIPQYSDTPKREPISAFSIMGQSNSRMSSGSSSTHPMMSARVASQPQQLLQQHQPPHQQRQQSILGTDASSGFITGPALSQELQQTALHPPVMILHEQLPLYGSLFGMPPAHIQAVPQQQDHQQFEQQLMLQLPESTSGTPTSMQQHQAQPYQFQAQPSHLQQQTAYMHQSRQQDAQQLPQQQHQQQQQESPLGPNHALSSAAPVSSVAVPSGGVVQANLEAWASSSTSTPTSGFSAHNNQIDWRSTSISHQPTSFDYSNRPFSPQTDSHYSFPQSPVGATTPSTATPSTAISSLAGSPAPLSGDYGYQQQQQQQQQQQKLRHNGDSLRQQVLTSSSPIQSRADELRDEAARIQKIARDILDCQQYDYSVFLPRHISQEYPELWVAPHSNQPGSLDGIPRQLLVLPKDANFLVDVFFENACFYYPILNRTAVELHLMEPHTAYSLFLLNIVFMAACKHLGKSTYIKRAIQFRERARELQYHIDGRVRLSRIQGALLGSQVIYGVFTVVIGFAQLCGSYIELPTRSNLRKVGDNRNGIESDDCGYNDGYDETMVTDIAEESRKLVAQKGVIPEAAYQQRLWSFWTIFARDSIARLYFGWPHGIDAVAITAELPTIKGSVGLGGRRKGLNGFGGQPGGGSGSGGVAGTAGKRRGAAMKPVLPPGRKVMKAADKSVQKQHKSERESYRVATTFSDDDDEGNDDEDDEAQGSDDDESDLEQGDVRFQGTPSMSRSSGVDATMNPAVAATGTGEKKGKWSFDGPLLPSVDGHEVAPSISGLSKTFLEKQSRGEDIHRRGSSEAGGSGSGSGSGSGGPGTDTHSSLDIKRHTERMKLLLDAEDDVTDGGTYSRILFLEEIKLWTIGRRAGLYLMGRGTSSSVRPIGAMTGSYSTTSSVNDLYGASTGTGLEVSDPFATTINATAEASRYSEQAWLEDKELQGLQAELMAWEQALPPMFKFRQDVDAPDINHKVNGKLAVLSLFYYTITIMLQTSYLPIPQYLTSSSRSTAFKSPESISQEYDELFSRSQSVTSIGLSDDGIAAAAQVKRESGDEYLSPNRFAYLRQQQQHQRSSSNGSLYGGFGSGGGIAGGYFNTAHKICTQLSNVLYHHLELMLDSYPNWCSIQSKLNHSLVAALRVSCLNARLSSNSQAIRDEAKAGFKMGSDLFKRLALLPDPLTIRDWPAEEDVKVMLDLEEEFREMMTTQEEEERSSRSHTRDQSEETAAAAAAAAAAAVAEGGIRMVFDEDPGDRLLYIPQNPDDAASLAAIAAAAAASAAEGSGMGASDPNSAIPVPVPGAGAGVVDGVGQQQQLVLDANNPLQYGLFRAEHVFGLGEGFQFDYSIGP
ncbi:hypothetical protein BGW39_001843 [Mortierella sp. 14UC]|nr:hypothetical protein BGW39_001843 [Mortierella sp. 14UC]